MPLRPGRLREALLVVPLFVLLTPLRLVGLRLGELLLRQSACLGVFARRMLGGRCPATRHRKGNDHQGYGDHGEDDPWEHPPSVLPSAVVFALVSARRRSRPWKTPTSSRSRMVERRSSRQINPSASATRCSSATRFCSSFGKAKNDRETSAPASNVGSP